MAYIQITTRAGAGLDLAKLLLQRCMDPAGCRSSVLGCWEGKEHHSPRNRTRYKCSPSLYVSTGARTPSSRRTKLPSRSFVSKSWHFTYGVTCSESKNKHRHRSFSAQTLNNTSQLSQIGVWQHLRHRKEHQEVHNNSATKVTIFAVEARWQLSASTILEGWSTWKLALLLKYSSTSVKFCFRILHLEPNCS